jgi:hypothetical protein
MTTERWRKEDPSETTMHERVKLCQGAIVVGPDAFERRPLARHPDGFPQCMLPERIRCACLMEFSSLRQREEQVSLVPQSSSVPRDYSDRASQVRLFLKRMYQVASTMDGVWMICPCLNFMGVPPTVRDALVFRSIPHGPSRSPVSAVIGLSRRPMTSVIAARARNRSLIRDRWDRCRPALVGYTQYK